MSKTDTATQEQVDAASESIQLGHNSIRASSLETMSQAKGMIAGFNNEGAFGDVAATLPDVTALLSEETFEEPEEDAQGKLEWLMSVRESDAKVKAVIEHYRTHRSAVSLHKH